MNTETEVETRSSVQPIKPPKKLKPARKQVKPGDVEKKQEDQTGKEYNIWYNKWAGGDREDSYSNKTKAQTRCVIKKDAGLTRANTTGLKYTCLFFARGCCPYGWECEYQHTLPDPIVTMPDSSKDCFARDKFADYRDDMGGVGSFNRQNRTLYVGRIKENGPGNETEIIVRRHFKEWGHIERIRVLQYRSVAFVTYTHEVHAQFAKEAMACQSLDNDEILNVRWATEDPNPTAIVEEHARVTEQGREAIRKHMNPKIIDAMRAVKALEEGGTLSDEEYEPEEPEQDDDEDEAPQAKKRRLEEEPIPAANGLLSADTLEGLKYYAEIRKRTQGEDTVMKAYVPPVKKPAAGLGLIDYGSDEDDE